MMYQFFAIGNGGRSGRRFGRRLRLPPRNRSFGSPPSLFSMNNLFVGHWFLIYFGKCVKQLVDETRGKSGR